MAPPQLKVLCLHGFTHNGQVMARQMGPLTRRLEEHVKLVFLDAPHECSEEAVDRLYDRWGGNRAAPPFLKWWDASDDLSEYRGWLRTLEVFRRLMDGAPPVALLGFSQGAILASALTLASEARLLPAIDSVVIVAGGAPRAPHIASLHSGPLTTPSLHVFGERDRLMGDAPAELARWYHAPERVTWAGSHMIPRRGDAADRIVQFLAIRASNKTAESP